MRDLMDVSNNLVFEFFKEMGAFLDRHPDRISDDAKAVFSIAHRLGRQETFTEEESETLLSYMDKLGAGFKTPEHPLDHLILAICCYLETNFELACMFSCVAFLRTGNMLAFIFLYYSMIKMDAKEPIAEYLELVEKAVPEIPRNMSMHYHRLARDHFYGGRMELCDHYVQRWRAMRHLRRKQHMNVEMCRINKNDFNRWQINRNYYFTPETEAQADKNYSKWLHDSNKHQVAYIVAELIYRYNLRSCLELGCHAGALMDMIMNPLKFWKYDVTMVGIEPDPGPLELARKKLPHCEFILGDHKFLETLRDRKFGVLLCSFICVLIMEEGIHAILDFASRSCEYVILVDDFSNMNWDRPVIRRHYILHNWVRLLNEHGFDIVDMIFLEEANEAANGIVISKNRHRLDDPLLQAG